MQDVPRPLGLDHRVGVPSAEGRAEGEQLADLRGLVLGDGQGDALAVAGRVGGGGHALHVARGHGVVQRGVLEGLVQGEPGGVGAGRPGRLIVAGHDHELTGRRGQHGRDVRPSSPAAYGSVTGSLSVSLPDRTQLTFCAM